MTRLTLALCLAAGPAWAGAAAQPVTIGDLQLAVACLGAIIYSAAAMAALRSPAVCIGMMLLFIVAAYLTATKARAAAYDEPGGWLDLICPPRIETVQLDALDVSPDAGTLLPPGLDPARFVTTAGPLDAHAGLTRPTTPEDPGTTPIALPWAAGLLIGLLAVLWLLSGVMTVRERWRMRG